MVPLVVFWQICLSVLMAFNNQRAALPDRSRLLRILLGPRMNFLPNTFAKSKLSWNPMRSRDSRRLIKPHTPRVFGKPRSTNSHCSIALFCSLTNTTPCPTSSRRPCRVSSSVEKLFTRLSARALTKHLCLRWAVPRPPLPRGAVCPGVLSQFHLGIAVAVLLPQL